MFPQRSQPLVIVTGRLDFQATSARVSTEPCVRTEPLPEGREIFNEVNDDTGLLVAVYWVVVATLLVAVAT
jgi:hypothetical protein